MSEPCTHPDHDKEWTICADCLARSEAKAHRVVTVYYCALCLTTMGTEAIPSLYPGTASAPHESLCRTCVERVADVGTTRTESRKLEPVRSDVMPLRPAVERRGLHHPIWGDAISVEGKPRRGTGERAASALHRLAHRVQAYYGIRECLGCNCITHNQWKPVQFTSGGSR